MPPSSRSSVVLPAPLRPSTTTRRAAVDREIHAGEDLERAVGLRQSLRGERGLAARGRLREADLGDLVGLADVVEPGQQPLRAPRHVLRGDRLRRLGAHLVGLRLQRGRLLLGVGPLAAAALLVGGARVEVALPAHVVEVDLAAHGVEEPDLVHHVGEQLDVVADHHEAAVVPLEEAAQPGDRVGVEVVGRLVEQQRGAGSVAAAPDSAAANRMRASSTRRRWPPDSVRERLGQHAVGEAEVGADARRLALRRVAAERGEPLLEPAVAADLAVAPAVVGVLGHRRLRLLHVAQQLVEAARGEHPVLRGDRQVALARVLRQVAELAGAAQVAGVRLALAGEDAQRGGLAGAVAADEADAVAGLDAQGRVGEQDARAGAQFEVGGGDHAETP